MQEPIETFVYELSWSLCNIAATNSETVLTSLIHYSVEDDAGNKVYLFVNFMSRTLTHESGKFQAHGIRFFANLMENKEFVIPILEVTCL